MYITSKLTEEQKREAAALGFTAEDYADPRSNVEVWPENWRYVKLFDALSTQWRGGFSGPTGLDYSVLKDTMELMGFERSEFNETFDVVRLMEAEALDEIHDR